MATAKPGTNSSRFFNAPATTGINGTDMMAAVDVIKKVSVPILLMRHKMACNMSEPLKIKVIYALRAPFKFITVSGSVKEPAAKQKTKIKYMPKW